MVNAIVLTIQGARNLTLSDADDLPEPVRGYFQNWEDWVLFGLFVIFTCVLSVFRYVETKLTVIPQVSRRLLVYVFPGSFSIPMYLPQHFSPRLSLHKPTCQLWPLLNHPLLHLLPLRDKRLSRKAREGLFRGGSVLHSASTGFSVILEGLGNYTTPALFLLAPLRPPTPTSHRHTVLKFLRIHLLKSSHRPTKSSVNHHNLHFSQICSSRTRKTPTKFFLFHFG